MLNQAGQSKLAEKPVLARVRQWAHGGEGLGEECARAAKPIFTQPSAAPRECRNPPCHNEAWHSQGIVIRDQHKRIVAREP